MIDATQKGMKPHTKLGLTRLKKKNALKQAKKKLISKKIISSLNPQSPETLCLKALRTEFREKLENKYNPIKRIDNIIREPRRSNRVKINDKTS